MLLSRRGSCYNHSFEAIPEVSPPGALVKVAYAGAHVRNNLNRNIQFSPVSSAKKLNISELELQKNLNKEPNSIRLHKQRKRRRYHNANSGTFCSEIDSKLAHNYELGGYIEMLGEEAESSSNFAIGDKVLIYPFEDLSNDYTEYVCVPDLRYLIKVPEELSLMRATDLASAALYVFNLGQEIKDQCRSFMEHNHRLVPKVLIVGSNSLMSWCMSILSFFFNKNAKESLSSPNITIAYSDDTIESVHPGFKFIRWPKDSYDEVLKELTLQCMEGQADIVVNLEATPKMLQRGTNCLKRGGKVLLLSGFLNIYSTQCLFLSTNLECEIVVPQPGGPETFQELINLVTSGEIRCPKEKEFSVQESKRLSNLSRNGSISVNPILRLL